MSERHHQLGPVVAVLVRRARHLDDREVSSALLSRRPRSTRWGKTSASDPAGLFQLDYAGDASLGIVVGFAPGGKISGMCASDPDDGHVVLRPCNGPDFQRWIAAQVGSTGYFTWTNRATHRILRIEQPERGEQFPVLVIGHRRPLSPSPAVSPRSGRRPSPPRLGSHRAAPATGTARTGPPAALPGERVRNRLPATTSPRPGRRPSRSRTGASIGALIQPPRLPAAGHVIPAETILAACAVIQAALIGYRAADAGGRIRHRARSSPRH